MRVVVNRKPLGQILRWTRHAFFAGSVTILGYCVFVVVDAWTFQKAERRQLERLLHDQQSATNSGSQTASLASLTDSRPAVTGDPIGRIEIPRVGLSAIVVEGSGPSTLRRAVGHIPGTALPGQPGNAGVTGHRDTFFRPLRNIQQNDMITLTTVSGEYRYRVVSTKIVSPHDVSVLDPSGIETLTLVTCYPFYFVGAAPNRFIVRAERVTW